MAVFDVRSHPRPPSVTSGHCCPAVAVRQPGYLPARRSLGFAPPPHSGFALLASTHGCAYLATKASYIGSQRHAILLGGCIEHVDDALPCCFAPPSVSVMPALLPKGNELPMNFEGLDGLFSTYLLFFTVLVGLGANFAEKMSVRTASNLR